MSDLFIRVDINLNFLCHYPNCAFFQCNNTGHGLLTIDAVNTYNILRGEDAYLHISKKLRGFYILLCISVKSRSFVLILNAPNSCILCTPPRAAQCVCPLHLWILYGLTLFFVVVGQQPIM